MSHGNHYSYRNGQRKPKQRYTSRARALEVARKFKAELGTNEGFTAYQCKTCNYFHIGSVSLTQEKRSLVYRSRAIERFAHTTAAAMRGKEIPLPFYEPTFY